MDADEKAEVAREVTAQLEHMGREMARFIMGGVAIYMIGPDEMMAMVEKACANIDNAFRDGGAVDRDREAAVAVYRGALVREGSRIARALDWQGGSA